MNFYNTGNRFNFFNEEEEENTEGNVFKTMRTKKKEKEKSTDDERFKFKSSLDAPPKAKEFTMETSAFPVLSTSTPPPPILIIKEKSFVGRLNKPQIVKVEPPPPFNSHWVTITRNKKTGKLTYKEQQQGTVEKEGTVEEETKKESKLVIKALTDLHIKRTNDYIKSWGQDEHYRTFYSTNFY